MSTITPLSTSPAPPPIPNVAEISPMPVETRSGGNSSRMIPKASGNTAAAMPWIARPAIRTSIECESAQTSEPSAKTESAITSMRSLPNMSPSRPRIGVETEAVRRNPVSTKVTVVVEVPSSSWIAGSAGTTIVCCRAKASAATSSTREREAVVLAPRRVAHLVSSIAAASARRTAGARSRSSGASDAYMASRFFSTSARLRLRSLRPRAGQLDADAAAVLARRPALDDPLALEPVEGPRRGGRRDPRGLGQGANREALAPVEVGERIDQLELGDAETLALGLLLGPPAGAAHGAEELVPGGVEVGPRAGLGRGHRKRV